MKIQYGRSPVGGNLGDELNLWLWPQLFGNDIFIQNDGIQFLGIGSILSSDPIYNKEWIDKKKVIFGTGIRPGEHLLQIDSSYDIMYMRGPLSCYALGLDPVYITDAAYCLQFTSLYSSLINQKKKYKIGLIPYFRSDKLINWAKLADDLGMHYISPLCEYYNINNILKEIASCDYIITEAMHGAIIADILRIPWSRFILTTYICEGSNVADFKWMDWMYSLKIPNKYYPIIRLTNKINHAIYYFTKHQVQLNTIFKHSLIDRMKICLQFDNLQFSLSNESIFNETKNKLEEQIIAFKEKYENCICYLS